MEEYNLLKQRIYALRVKKRAVDKTLGAIEQQLYEFEGEYLKTTAAMGGNIVEGFDKNGMVRTGRRKEMVSGSDRLFSASSATLQKSLEQ